MTNALATASFRMLFIHQAVRVLNEALESEPEAVHKIFTRYPTHTSLLDSHPTIQVGQTGTLSALGLINGMFGVREDGWGYIQTVEEFDDVTRERVRIIRFEVREPKNQPTPTRGGTKVKGGEHG